MSVLLRVFFRLLIEGLQGGALCYDCNLAAGAVLAALRAVSCCT